MPRLAADENLDNDLIRALVRRLAGLEIIRVQDAGLSGALDGEVLEWAARQGSVLLTHAANTMIAIARQRVEHGLPMPGLVVVPQDAEISRTVEDILLLAQCSLDGE
jgi:hypothetical protein